MLCLSRLSLCINRNNLYFMFGTSNRVELDSHYAPILHKQ